MAGLFAAAGQMARHVGRQLRKSPGFFAAAVVTLGLGIGANAAMFSVVYGILLKPLPFSQPDRLVAVRNTAPGIGWPRCPLASATYFTYREENRVFDDLAAWSIQRLTITGGDEPERLPALLVTEGFLGVLRIRPLLGRGFRSEDLADPARAVIITYGYWQQHFAGDRGVIGRTLTVNGVPREIVGVLPKEPALVEPFSSPTFTPGVLMPLPWDRARTSIGNFGFQGLARLKPGVAMDEANRDVLRMVPLVSRKFQPAPGLPPTFMTDAKMGADVHPLGEDVTGNVSRVLWVLMEAIAIVFLIACANVANLFLVRAEGRQQELAVRSALGASRAQIARALLSESLGLGICGGVVGIAFAEAGIRAIRATAPAALPRVNDIALHPLVLLFVALLSVVAGLLFGLIPVLKFASPRLAALKDGGRSASESRDRHRTRSLLVVSEIALALALLVASGLMIRSFQALRQVDPGFSRGDQLLTFGVSLSRPLALDAEKSMRRLYEIAGRIEQVAGVQSIGLTSSTGLDGGSMSNPLFVEEFPQTATQAPVSRRMKWITPGYFETMGTPLVAGRLFTWNELFSFARVVVINDRMARTFWKTPADAIGKRVRESVDSPWREIVGVVQSMRDDGLGQEPPALSYWPAMVKDFFATPIVGQSSLVCVVRSSRTSSPAFLDEIRRAIWSVDKTVPLSNVRSMDQMAARSIAQTSFALVMLAIAAGVALVLGIVGIYGVIAYITAQRTREVGIRVALGAQPGDVSRLFLRHGASLAAVGIALGVGAALLLSRLMTSLLFGVSARDPLIYAVVAAGLASVALVASYVPSRRAARMHPVSALRSDL